MRRRLGVARAAVRLLLLGCALWLAMAGFGQEYRVDPSGGPLTLSEDVQRAAAAWNDLDEQTTLEEAAGAPALIAFGDPEAMGPDTVSLTLLANDADAFEVLLHPGLYREFPGSLLHELGLLIGLPAGGPGVMEPALVPEAPARLGEEEAAQLVELRSRVPGDLNGDGEVGLADLARLGRAYGQRGVNLPADLDGDGQVGASDLEVLREVYRFEPPAPPEDDRTGADPE